MKTKPRSSNVSIALLRGINVGRAKRIAMADLRELVERLGYGDVKTILNSGNIVFTSGDSAESSALRIEEALVARLGISSRITGLSLAELSRIITENPLPVATEQPSRFLVAVARDASAIQRLGAMSKQDWGSERLAVGKRAAYLWCPDGILDGKVVEAVGRALGDGATTRNWATLNKIRDAAESIAGQ